MPDKLQLYNEALHHCKEPRLADLAETREARFNLDLHYDSTLKFMIEQGFWKFAMRSVSITRDTAISPAFGYTGAFNHPEDLVTVYQMGDNETFDPPLLEWIDESNLFWANRETLYCRYVSNSSDGYGYDLNRWTGRFQLAFTTELGSRVLPTLAGASGDMADFLDKKKAKALAEALSLEALKEPARRPPVGNWVRGRFGGRSVRRENF